MMVRQTSKAAYNAIRTNGLLSKRRWQVYDFVYHHGPCTAKEVTSALRKGDEDSGGYNTRLSELRDAGVVVEVGTRKCASSGHTVILWDVTDSLPVKVKRPKTRLQATREELKEVKALLKESYGLLNDGCHDDFLDRAAKALGIKRKRKILALVRERGIIKGLSAT